jgi:hypothetical protein
MIPLYGFLRGDTLGLLILGEETDTVAELAEKLQRSARLRVPTRAHVRVMYRGRELEPSLTLKAAELEPLCRFDVIEGEISQVRT